MLEQFWPKFMAQSFQIFAAAAFLFFGHTSPAGVPLAF
jgi:hypothetical protein